MSRVIVYLSKYISIYLSNFSIYISNFSIYLSINLSISSHDSERSADSQEMTSSGHPRNCITNKTARIVVAVHDNRAGKGIMSDDINFYTEVSSPIIKIERATYGYFEDLTKVVDVTCEIQAMVTSRGNCSYLSIYLDITNFYITNVACFINLIFIFIFIIF
jgi:hypothetical protein